MTAVFSVRSGHREQDGRRRTHEITPERHAPPAIHPNRPPRRFDPSVDHGVGLVIERQQPAQRLLSQIIDSIHRRGRRSFGPALRHRFVRPEHLVTIHWREQADSRERTERARARRQQHSRHDPLHDDEPEPTTSFSNPGARVNTAPPSIMWRVLPCHSWFLAPLALAIGTIVACTPAEKTARADVTLYLQRANDGAPVEAETARTIDRILATQFVDEA